MEEIKICPKCGGNVQGSSKFCMICGETLQGVADVLKNWTYTKLIAQVKEGDNQAIEELYNRAVKFQYFTAEKYTNNSYDAQDVFHDAFMRALSHLDQLKNPEGFNRWFERIVATTAINANKKERPMNFSDITPDETRMCQAL